MQNDKSKDEFLEELNKLCNKYNLYIDSCCCTLLYQIKERKELEYLNFEATENGVKYSYHKEKKKNATQN